MPTQEMSLRGIVGEYEGVIMRTSQLSVAIFFFAALSNPFPAYSGSADINGDKGTKTEPVTKSDTDCDHTNGLPTRRYFRLTL